MGDNGITTMKLGLGFHHQPQNKAGDRTLRHALPKPATLGNSAQKQQGEAVPGAGSPLLPVPQKQPGSRAPGAFPVYLERRGCCFLWGGERCQEKWSEEEREGGADVQRRK